MAEYALAGWEIVPASIIRSVESFTLNDETAISNNINVRSDLDIGELVSAHSALVKIVEPAKPKTILLLDMEQKAKGFIKFLGRVENRL